MTVSIIDLIYARLVVMMTNTRYSLSDCQSRADDEPSAVQ